MLNFEEEQLEEAPVPRTIFKIFRRVPKYFTKVSPTYYKPVVKRREKKMNTCSAHTEVVNVPLTSISLQDIHDSESSVDISHPVNLKCLVCMEGKSEVVLMDCGHGGLCAVCANNLMENTGVCHICRSSIEYVVEIKQESKTMAAVKRP